MRARTFRSFAFSNSTSSSSSCCKFFRCWSLLLCLYSVICAVYLKFLAAEATATVATVVVVVAEAAKCLCRKDIKAMRIENGNQTNSTVNAHTHSLGGSLSLSHACTHSELFSKAVKFFGIDCKLQERSTNTLLTQTRIYIQALNAIECIEFIITTITVERRDTRGTNQPTKGKQTRCTFKCLLKKKYEMSKQQRQRRRMKKRK